MPSKSFWITFNTHYKCLRAFLGSYLLTELIGVAMRCLNIFYGTKRKQIAFFENPYPLNQFFSELRIGENCTFWSEFFHQTPLNIFLRIETTWCEHLKCSPTLGEYSREKIRVIRRFNQKISTKTSPIWVKKLFWAFFPLDHCSYTPWTRFEHQ